MFQHDIEWWVESSRYLFYFLPQKARTFTEKSRMEITKKDQKGFFFVFLNSSVFFRVFRGKKTFPWTR